MLLSYKATALGRFKWVLSWVSPCPSPGLGPLDTVGTGKILDPCTASAWSWWNRCRQRSDGPNVSRACQSVRMGSSGCSSPGTQTLSAPRCRRTLHRDWAGCCAAEPWVWAKPDAWSPERHGARAALWYLYCSVPRHAVLPCFTSPTNAQSLD